MTKSFSDLKPGDQVILVGGSRKIVTIDRVTKTQIIIDSYRFNRKKGHEIGKSIWVGMRLLIATPELIAEVKAEQQSRKTRNRAYALIEEFKEQYHYSDKLIAALPHLEKAVNVLTSTQKAD